MNEVRYPRGSEWRRWDLHIHTPYSTLSNEFGGDFDEYARRVLKGAVQREIATIGITDYFTIDGYRDFRKLMGDPVKLEELLGASLADKARRILILPNIEFRTSVIVTRPGQSDARVNFHVLFSDELEPDFIEEHFLRDLRFTAQSSPDSADERWSLTRANLQALGETLKLEHSTFADRSDLFIGTMNAVISHEEVTRALESQPSRFKDRYLLVAPADEDLSTCSWDGQAHLVRKLFIQKSHMLFSANQGTRAFGLGQRHDSKKAFVAEFKSIKPCIYGSDAHSFEGLFEPAQQRYLWIKADPSFDGLRQLLHEPESRVFIGEEPESKKHVVANATKYMMQLEFHRTESATDEAKWFSGSIPLNQGLVAIIGNKGSGKSALADILALLGNSHQSADFSFLTESRFLAAKPRWGRMFTATLTWCSGRPISRSLDAATDTGAPELVKYLPQNYLETICTELSETKDSQFDRELMEVIFSHVGEADRLGLDTLPDLVAYRTAEKEQRISQLISELEGVNGSIITLQEQLLPKFREGIQAELELRQSELSAHDAAKPREVPAPEVDPLAQEQGREAQTLLQEVAEAREPLEIEIELAREKLRQSTLRSTVAAKLLSRIDNLDHQIAAFIRESTADCEALGINLFDVISINLNRESVSEAKRQGEEQTGDLKGQLDPGIEGSLTFKLSELAAKAEDAQSRLDEPNRRRQAYLHELEDWRKRHTELEGSASSIESLKGAEAKLRSLDLVPGQLKAAMEARARIVAKIAESKYDLLSDYRTLYAPVQNFIDRHPVSQQQGALEFSASVMVDGLVEGLLEMLHQGRKGSFQGDKEGADLLRRLVASADFTTVAGVHAFLAATQEHLDNDKREGETKPLELRSQLRQGRTPHDVYRYLYGLTYLQPRFELRWQGKSLDQLSPGERGNLLLVFYLLIDMRTVPLIIDQPEENLDNHTIATLLVPAVKHAKERRQIVIVTHNPNLAVVCDAEQVIYAEIDKAAGNKLVYASGAIEDPIITQRIVDVLEGTKPAFDLRDARYQVLDTV